MDNKNKTIITKESLIKNISYICNDDFVSMSDTCISTRHSVVIGNYVTIGGDVLIIDSNAHCIDWKLRRE